MNASGPSRFKIFCFASLLALSGSLAAQGVDPSTGDFSWPQGGSMPTWVVPVLRLVSTTHVEPTTGIVLSASGLVLVPAEFASPGDEIVVLDGGTDIVRNGRRAHIEKRFSDLGVEVLAVEGLVRRPASLAPQPPGANDELWLTAFPPAESIARGEAPIRTAARVVVYAENGKISISAETPLPNVTGPLLDQCGDLVAVSIASPPQTMDPSSDTRYDWLDDLNAIVSDLGVEPAPSTCQARVVPAAAPAEAEANAPAEGTEEPPPQPVAANESETGDESATPPEKPDEESLAEPAADESGLGITELPPYEESVSTTPPAEPESRAWIWLVGALVLLTLGATIHLVRRAGRGRAGTTAPGRMTETGAEVDKSAEAEPVMSPFEHLLTLSGMRSDGQPIEASCAVSERAVNVVIGRTGADLPIDSEAVSRQHARLNGNRGSLTLCDLGSRNGTAVNGIPCLEGEILFVEPGDTITLGDVQVTIDLLPLDGKKGRP
ncbi:MAG: FHA domain-containing protein [Lysobacterales bacterium]|jgi:hypothetical protein